MTAGMPGLPREEGNGQSRHPLAPLGAGSRRRPGRPTLLSQQYAAQQLRLIQETTEVAVLQETCFDGQPILQDPTIEALELT